MKSGPTAVLFPRSLWILVCLVIIDPAGIEQPREARSDAVGTANKSIAAMSFLWLRKNATRRFT